MWPGYRWPNGPARPGTARDRHNPLGTITIRVVPGWRGTLFAAFCGAGGWRRAPPRHNGPAHVAFSSFPVFCFLFSSFSFLCFFPFFFFILLYDFYRFYFYFFYVVFLFSFNNSFFLYFFFLFISFLRCHFLSICI